MSILTFRESPSCAPSFLQAFRSFDYQQVRRNMSNP